MNDNWKKLSKYLAKCNEEKITLSFENIEAILCAKLPEDALKPEWWWNRNSSEIAKCWLAKDYKTIHVKDTIQERRIIFKKQKNTRLVVKKKSLLHLSKFPLFNENNPIRKKVAFFLPGVLAIMTIIGTIYSIKSYKYSTTQLYTTSYNMFNERYEIGEKYLNDKNFVKAEEYFILALKTYDELKVPYDLNSIKAFDKLAGIYSKIGLNDKALNYYLEESYIIENLKNDKEAYYDLYIDIAYTYLMLTEFEKAEEYLNKVKVFFDSDFDIFEQIISSLYYECGIDNEQGDSYTANTEIDLSEEDLINLNIAKLINYLELIELEASIDLFKGNYETSASLYEKILSVWNCLYDNNIIEDNIKSAILYDHLGICYIRLGNLEKAKEFNQIAIDILDNKLGKRNIDTGISYSNMGMTYLETGYYETAYEYLSQSAAIIKDTIGENNERMATIYNNIGLYYFYSKKYEQAETYFLKCLDIYSHLNVQNIGLLRTNISYCQLLIEMDRLYEARERVAGAYALASIMVDKDAKEYQQCREIKDSLQFVDILKGVK